VVENACSIPRVLKTVFTPKELAGDAGYLFVCLLVLLQRERSTILVQQAAQEFGEPWHRNSRNASVPIDRPYIPKCA